jgi:hypothetical protein
VGHDVRTAACRVRPHRLPIRNDNDGQDGHDDQGEGDAVDESSGPRRDEDEHHLLGRVRVRGQRVRREHREREEFGEELVFEFFRWKGAAQEDALQSDTCHEPTGPPEAD